MALIVLYCSLFIITLHACQFHAMYHTYEKIKKDVT